MSELDAKHYGTKRMSSLSRTQCAESHLNPLHACGAMVLQNSFVSFDQPGSRGHINPRPEQLKYQKLYINVKWVVHDGGGSVQ